MRLAGPWETPLSPDDDQKRQEIRQRHLEQTQRLFAAAHREGPEAMVEAARQVQRNEAIAVLSIPDPHGVITPLPQDPGLHLVHDPYGEDIAYQVLTQLRHDKAVVDRALNQGEIDGPEHLKRHDKLVDDARRKVLSAAMLKGQRTGNPVVPTSLLNHPEMARLFKPNLSGLPLKKSQQAAS